MNLDELMKEVEGLDEHDAMALYRHMAFQHSWAGTYFTRDDAESAWNATRDYFVEEHENGYDTDPIPPEFDDAVWEQIRQTRTWRKGLGELLYEQGWELVENACAVVRGEA